MKLQRGKRDQLARLDDEFLGNGVRILAHLSDAALSNVWKFDVELRPACMHQQDAPSACQVNLIAG